MTTAVGWHVTAGERAALLRKYRLLAAWRLARDADGGEGERANRAALKALAEEFPGALRELDVLGLPEIERRIERLAPPEARGRKRLVTRAGKRTDETPASRPGRDPDRGGASPGGASPGDDRWIAWILAYHALMRAALATKQALGGAPPSPSSLSLHARRATAVAGVRIDEAFVRAVARPPDGRLATVVLRAVSARFNVPPALLATTLFPPRRPAHSELPPSTP